MVQAHEYGHTLASDRWTYPTTGFRISTWFGEAGSVWSSGYHTGIDMSAGLGTPVVAVTRAIVVAAGWDGPYGNQVRIQLSKRDQAWYNHLSRFDVGVGQVVTEGETLGAVGDTGNSFGSHLHFEYRLAADTDTAIDPAPVLAAHGLGL